MKSLFSLIMLLLFITLSAACVMPVAAPATAPSKVIDDLFANLTDTTATTPVLVGE